MTHLLAIGDIHGCFTALTALAEFVPFRDSDLLVTLGDYVDRGPDSRAVLDWLIARQSTTGRLISLRGNHEVMMLEAREAEAANCAEENFGWLSVGGRETLDSYRPDGTDGQLTDIPAAHWDFLEQTHRYYETATHFFVHANAHSDLTLADQSDEALFWEKFRNPPPHCSSKIMVCGHTPQSNLRPLDIGHAVCIDTWVYRNGWLTCLNPATGEYWQANQQGQTRRDRLNP